MGFIGVAIGAYTVVQSVMMLSAILNIPEYIISFFLVAIGTSLRELASLLVILTLAIRKRMDKRAEAIFIALYLLSYTLLII